MGKPRIVKTEVRPGKDGSITVFSYSQSPRGTRVVVNSVRRDDGNLKEAMASIVDRYPTNPRTLV